MDEKCQDYRQKFKKLLQFQISKSLLELLKSDLISLESIQINYNLSQDDFLKERKRLLDSRNDTIRALLDLIDQIF